MSIYENCYEILGDVRRGINEYSEAYVQASDTTCTHTNEFLLKCISRAQRYLYAFLFKRIKGEFLKSSSLTASSSVLTLPWDFGSLIELKDSNGRRMFSIPVSDFKLTNSTGSDRMYYRKGNTLVIDEASNADTYTLWYYKKPRDLNFGQATAGAATSMTLATTAKALADYYNEMTVENITSGWVDTIDDYSSARVCTISETAAASDWYGIVPDFPEIFHTLIAPKAVHIAKADSPVIQEKPDKNSLDQWNAELIEALRSFSGEHHIDIEELFCDYEPGMYWPTGGIILQ